MYNRGYAVATMNNDKGKERMRHERWNKLKKGKVIPIQAVETLRVARG
jgi:hypothetical protein